MTKTVLISICVAFALSACVSAINQKSADRYYEAGLQAESAKNWPLARQNYSRALVNARSGGAGMDYVSAVTYNLGRVTGYSCDYAQAESLLIESLALEQALPKPSVGNLMKRWSELGRLNFDQGKFKESAAWLSQAMSELERLNVPADDPIGFARFLEDAALAFEKSSGVSQAATLRSRADVLRIANPQRSANFLPTYYRDVCVK